MLFILQLTHTPSSAAKLINKYHGQISQFCKLFDVAFEQFGSFDSRDDCEYSGVSFV